MNWFNHIGLSREQDMIVNTEFGFPVVIYQDGVELPKSGVYFVVAGNGLFMHKETGICSVFTPVKDLPILKDLNQGVKLGLNIPKMPSRAIVNIKEFFKRILEKYNSESELNLMFNKDTSEYKIYAPKQTVSYGSVNYDNSSLLFKEEFSGFIKVGTIHAHSDFDAFHSGTDIHDEENKDGFHITFGHNDKDEFSITASVVVNGIRSKVDPQNLMKGICHIKDDIYSIESDDPISEDLINCWISNVSQF